MVENKQGVYSITNTIDGMTYIGSAKNIRTRWNCHKHQLKNNNHHCQYLQNAYNKHGKEFFEFKIIKETIELEKYEQHWLDIIFKSNINYNVLNTAYKVIGENHPMFGKHHSEETKEKIRNKRKLQTIKHSQETKNKIKKSNSGKMCSQETKTKISETKKRSKQKSWSKGLTKENCILLKEKGLKQRKYINVDLIIKLYKNKCSINKIHKNTGFGWESIKRCLIENNQYN